MWCKRGIITDTLGLLLAVVVTAASASDNTIGTDLLERATHTYPTLTKTWVDAGFKTTVVEYGAQLGVDVETVTKDPQVKGFSVIKRRWVVGRTLGWLMQHRRLARDHETLPATSATMIRIAMIDNLTRRATGETTPTWRFVQLKAPLEMPVTSGITSGRCRPWSPGTKASAGAGRCRHGTPSGIDDSHHLQA